VTVLRLGWDPLSVGEVVEFGFRPRRVELVDGIEERVAQSREIVDRQLAEGGSIYGLTTSLGSKVGVRLNESESQWTEELILLNRMVAIGEALPIEVCRSAMLLRLKGLVHGAAGVSPSVVNTLLEMLNRDLVIQIPGFGSIGASDLGPGAVLGAGLVGHGFGWVEGQLVPMQEAMRKKEIQACHLARKDAIGLFNSSAVSLARAAHVIANLRSTMARGFVVGVASADAFGVNPQVYREDVTLLKPSPNAPEAAALVRGLLSGSWVMNDGAVESPQQAISFRALVPSVATMTGAIERLIRAVEFEMNSVSDNPAVLFASGEMSSTSHFHTLEAALHVDAMAIAVSQWSNASAQRVQRLINHRDPKLPQLLSGRGGAATGLNPLQKTVAALHAAIRLRAMPVSMDALAVSDQVEDVASHLPLAVEKLEEQAALLDSLVAVEAFVASHAFGFREGSTPGVGVALINEVVMEKIGRFEEDRAVGPIVESLAAALRERSDDFERLVKAAWPNCPLVC
jgi:histidine ammonia-lyase